MTIEDGLRWRWERALRESGLGNPSPSVVAVGFALATFGDAGGRSIFPGDERLATGLGLSLSTIKRARGDLEDGGWIKPVGKPNRARKQAQEWRLAIPDQVSPITPTPPVDQVSPMTPTQTRSGVIEDPIKCHEEVDQVSPMTPHQNIDTRSSTPDQLAAAEPTEEQIKALIAIAPSFEDGPASPGDPAEPMTTAEIEEHLAAECLPKVVDDPFRSSPPRTPHPKDAIYERNAHEQDCRERGIDPDTGEPIEPKILPRSTYGNR